ncbi:uncharacterized protein LOC142332848 [Lycorma delicatula]|uniref:uncharacterized protein LOC142332848 n=1 Tax=Lycorma delicatula TaxID=130591 RepID=UPI003F514414
MINKEDNVTLDESNDKFLTTNIKRNLIITKTRSMPSSPNSFRQLQEQQQNINKNKFNDDGNKGDIDVDEIADKEKQQKFCGELHNNHNQNNPIRKYTYLLPDNPIITNKVNKSVMKSLPIFSKLDKKCSTSEPDIMIMKKQNNVKSKIKLSNSDCVNSFNKMRVIVNNSTSDNSIAVHKHQQQQQPSESRSEGQISSISTMDIITGSKFQDSSSSASNTESGTLITVNNITKEYDSSSVDQTCSIDSGTDYNNQSFRNSFTNRASSSAEIDDKNSILFQTGSKSGENLVDISVTGMIPDSRGCNNLLPSSKNNANKTNMTTTSTDDGIILPKKIQNPCLESSDRQNLHRELLFNQKIGKNVLNQKSELQRALEKHKDSQAKKELELQRLEDKTPLERVIEERARRLESLEKGNGNSDSNDEKQPEFLQVHARLRARMDSK